MIQGCSHPRGHHSDLHRFTDPDEATATLALREGQTEALDFYFTRDRVASGTSEAMLEDSYEAWAADAAQGLTSLLIASAGRDVTALNARARLERIHDGHVQPGGTELRDGNRAGVGDRIVTRANNRTLTTLRDRDFVKNGDTWTVQDTHDNGDLIVRHTAHGGMIRLPREYVSDSVELGYATTTARAQGMTVETAHVLVDESTSREALYVAATRGRQGARLYVASQDLIGIDAERPPAPAPESTARDVLIEALHRETGERAATEVRREAAIVMEARKPAARRFVSETVLRDRHIGTVTRALGPASQRESSTTLPSPPSFSYWKPPKRMAAIPSRPYDVQPIDESSRPQSRSRKCSTIGSNSSRPRGHDQSAHDVGPMASSVHPTPRHVCHNRQLRGYRPMAKPLRVPLASEVVPRIWMVAVPTTSKEAIRSRSLDDGVAVTDDLRNYMDR